MLSVHWVQSTTKAWLPFQTFNISGVNDSGVYVIWHGGNPGRVVYVGQGDIKARLTAHRSNKLITQYAAQGTLYVTWAVLPASQLDGVERYLADKLNPLIGDAHPNALPIAVNW